VGFGPSRNEEYGCGETKANEATDVHDVLR
jgi:hypothetical protein